jgi:hypothetical protein
MKIGRIGAATLLALTLSGATLAQAPTTAQRNAIRQSCRADYQSLCASVPTGGQASLQCLQQNMSSLSSACQSAVGAVGGGSGGTPPANRPQSAGAGGRPMEACRGDYFALCRGIRPGGGRAMMCLREHASELSPPCQQSLMALRR